MFERGGLKDFNLPRPFAHGMPEIRNFPLQLWERLERQVFRELGCAALASSPPQGQESLRQAIADYVNLERGAHATADRILVLTSSQQAFTLCATVLFDFGDRVFIEDPAYHGMRRAFDAAGVMCLPVPVDGEGMQIEYLEGNALSAKGISLTPSHQFPTGATLSLERRLAIIEWARREQAWIIEDDYDSEFHYAGKPHACVQGLDQHDRTIYIGTFTKSMFPGLRIGYMVLPLSLVEPMTAARSLLDGHNATISQLTLARFMEGGHFGAHVRVMRLIYAERRDVLEKLVREHLGGFVEPKVPVGGMQMPCVFICDISECDFIERARQLGIDLIGLTKLHATNNCSTGFLMGFAAYTAEEMEVAIMKLGNIFRLLVT